MKYEKREFFLLLCGTALMALGTECFFARAELAAGGFTGIGILLDAWTMERYGFPVPLWTVNAALNLPLFFFAWKSAGRKLILKTVLASSLFSLMLYFAEQLPLGSEEPFHAAVIGGALVGAGLSRVLSAGGTTGGVDLLAFLIHRRLGKIPVARIILFLDAAIILTGLGVFGGEKCLYAVLAVFVTERVMHRFPEQGESLRAAWVFSDRAGEVGAGIFSELGVEIFILRADEPLRNGNRELVFCIVSHKEMGRLKNIIRNIDKKAFVFAGEITEVMGKEKLWE